MRKTNIVAIALALVFGTFACASAQQKATRLQGSIVSADAASVTVAGKSGNQTARLDPHVRIFDVSKSSLDKVTPGSFIGTTVIPQSDGTYKSTEVHIFEPALRGMGEGFTKMNPSGTRMMANSTVRPVNMMANSTVRSVSAQAGGKTISMTFPSGKKIISIPPSVPVSYLTRGSKSLLVKGANALLICSGTPGHLTVKTIVITEKGASLQ